MIIASIGHQEYELANLADADAILKILDRAKPIDSKYTPAAGSYYIADNNCRSISIEITSKQIVTQEQHKAFMAEAATKAALKDAA